MKINIFYSFLLNLFLLGLMSFNVIAVAQTTAPKNKHHWQNIANDVCQQLNSATNLYQESLSSPGKQRQAYMDATMTYFRTYDPNLEPAVRMNMDEKHVVDIEKEFHDLSSAMKEQPTDTQIKTVKQSANSICDQVTIDAKKLDHDKVSPETLQASV